LFALNRTGAGDKRRKTPTARGRSAHSCLLCARRRAVLVGAEWLRAVGPLVGLVAVARLDDDEVVVLDGVDEPAVFLVDAAGPEAGQVAGETFRFAGADTTVAGRFADEAVDPGESLSVAGPAAVILQPCG
jgi:hypothetical protein